MKIDKKLMKVKAKQASIIHRFPIQSINGGAPELGSGRLVPAGTPIF
jgi:hypothetical protein